MPEELRNLTTECRDKVEATLTAALLRPAALARADYLAGEPMEKLRAAAAEPLAAVAAAQAALHEEKESLRGRLAAFYTDQRRKDPDDDERPPDNESPRSQELEAALTAAGREAAGPESKVRLLEQQIQALRAAPEPDAAVLTVLAAALRGGAHHATD